MDPASKQAAKYKTAAVLGIINDKLEVGIAKIRGEESAALDVAIIKATLQDEVVPKEKHVRTLKIACNGSSPRQTVNYVIHGLAKRLEENPKAWLVTLKTLVVFHRLMRETDPTFQEELLRYAERTGHHRMLRLESFADHTTKETWDLSAWIRVYSLYLDERLAVFRSMKFDPEQDQGLEARESKLKSCSAQELLDHLPAVQRLLGRLVSCVPEGAAQANEIALLACSLVLKEVRSVYKVVSEGVLNLVDRFFEMDRGDALKGVELVKENLAVNERLNTFVSTIGNIPPLRGAVQFPTVQPLPSDFLTTLEDYIKDAPRGPGETSKPVIGRSGSTAQRGLMSTSQAFGGTAPRLIVGGPIKDPPSGPTSPLPVPAPTPTAAPVVDLLGFESLSIAPTPPAPAAAPSPAGAPPAPSPAAAPFDPFASFGGAPAPPAGLAQAAPQPPPPQQPAAPVGAPPPYPYGQGSSFVNPAAAAVAAGAPFGFPGVPAPQAPAMPPPSPGAAPPIPVPYGDGAFGAANSYAAPPPFLPPPGAGRVPAPPAVAPAAPATSPAAASAPFNPFANPSTHATVAPHMPPPAAAPVPSPAGPANAFAPPPAAPAYPAPPAAAAPPPPQLQLQQPAPGAFPDHFHSPGTPSPAPVAAPPPVPANPFGSPGSAAAAAPSNPFGAAPTAPAGGGMFSSTAPFAQGAPPSTWPGTVQAPQHGQAPPMGAAPPPPSSSNPFGGPAPPQAGAGGMFSPNAPLAASSWPAPAPGAPGAPVVTQQVGGYNLKKPADPLMDLSLDLFGKPQAPPTQQPMRPIAGPGPVQNGNGSPGGLF